MEYLAALFVALVVAFVAYRIGLSQGKPKGGSSTGGGGTGRSEPK